MTSPAMKFDLNPNAFPGIVHVDALTDESAKKTSELLNLNHEKWHNLFEQKAGFHNHILHHLLCIYSLGATPEQLQKAYDNNTSYQLPAYRNGPEVAKKLHDGFQFEKHLGNDIYFEDFTDFFEGELAAKGVPAVLNEYLFATDARAEDLFDRMHSGLYHCIIHLGYGLEYNQPTAIAEALGQIATHESWMNHLPFQAEEIARASPPKEDKTIIALADEIRDDPKMKNAVLWSDPGVKLLTGLVPRAGDRLVEHFAKYTVTPDNLERKTAEMIHFNVWLLATAQNPERALAFDFLILHNVTLSLWYSLFLKQDWLSVEDKCRMLEWKVRTDLAIFATCGSPKTYHNRIDDHQPRKPGDWQSIFARTNVYPDDGHAAKFIRAVKNAEEVSAKFSGTDGFPVLQGGFLKIAHMLMDTVERMQNPEYITEELVGKVRKGNPRAQQTDVAGALRWIFYCGFEEAWDVGHVPSVSSGL